MEDVTQSGSQTVESQNESVTQETAIQDALTAFGITPAEKETPEEGKETSEGSESPAIETTPTEQKTIKVKHNKEEVEVDISTDEKLTDHLQRSLALDKERERKSEYEKNLDRVAKLQGYKDHSELIANLDKIEQQQQQQKQDQFSALRGQLIQDYEFAGGDPEHLTAWLDNNPLLNEAKEVLVRDQEREIKQQEEIQNKQWLDKWSALYVAYPHLSEDGQAFARGEKPTFYTAEMQERVARGYDPVDAFELAHKGTIQAQTKKSAEQKAIKDQMLGKRSQVETVSIPDNEPEVSSALSSAFSAFGLNPSAAKKYVKK